MLILGFLISGLIKEFIPSDWVIKNLGGKGMIPIFYATIGGTILPVCCFGSLPIAISFYRKGARLGLVLAFLVATPATSISALLVTYRLLGLDFTVYIFLPVIALGLILGIHRQPDKIKIPNYGGSDLPSLFYGCLFVNCLIELYPKPFSRSLSLLSLRCQGRLARRP